MRMNLNPFFKRLNFFGAMLIFTLSTLFNLQAVWQPAQVINDPTFLLSSTTSPDVLVVNPQGNAIAIFTSEFTPVFPTDPNPAGIWTAFYLRNVGWQPPQIISDQSLNSVGTAFYTLQGDPDIAMNASNYAVGVWEATFFDSANNIEYGTVLASTRNPATGIWSPAAQLAGNVAFYADNINVSLNDAGTALAAWRFTDQNTFALSIAVSFLPLGGSWTTPFVFPSFPALSSGDGKPCPAINPSGNAVLTWEGNNVSGRYTVMAATYDVGTNTWSAPVTLDTDLIGRTLSEDPRCAIDSSGNAVAIWAIENIVKAAYFDGTSWGPAVILGDVMQSVGNDAPAVVMDPNGNITAVWPTVNGEIKAAFRLPNGTWVSQTISTGINNSFDAWQSSKPLAVNPEGDVITIWETADGAIFSAFKPFGFDWRAPELVSTIVPDEFTTNIGLASCGFAVASWQAFSTFVYAAVNENLLLPLNARGSRCCQKFATQTRCVNIFTWAPDPCALFFNIYRNGVLIATVPNTGGVLQFIDPLAQRNSNANYSISIVNFTGFEGAQVPITF